MRILNLLTHGEALFIATATVSTLLAAPFAQAIQTLEGVVSFEAPPRLEDTSTTFNNTRMWGAKYYFTLTLPDNAGEPLKKVTITQLPSLEEIDYQQNDTFAFKGTARNKGERLNVGEVTKDEESQTLSVIFDPPIQPGTTFTVGLKPVRNPAYGGVYLFRVKAFPVGEKPYGLDLGVGRLHFYQPHFW